MEVERNIKPPQSSIPFYKVKVYDYVPGFLIFTLLFVMFSYMYNYHNVLFFRPDGIHQWRQTDCLSYTDNFYYGDAGFWAPAIYFSGNDGTGKTVSEFPVLYWTVAQLWKITGKQEWVYRVLVLFLFFMGLLAVFRVSEYILKDSFWALFVSFALFTSPFLAFYANNFLVDVPALSMVFMAWFLILRLYVTRKFKFALGAALLFLLAGLLKATAALSLFVLLVAFILRKGSFPALKWELPEALDVYTRKILFLFVGVISLWTAWYAYATFYTEVYNNGIFLVGILPIWKADRILIQDVLFHLWNTWFHHFFRLEMHIMLWGMFVFLIWNFKKISVFYITLIVGMGLAYIAFFILFFQVFNHHDYYTLNLLIFFPLLVLTFLRVLRKYYKTIFRSMPLRVLLVLFIMHNADFTRRRMLSRYEFNPETHTGIYFNILPWLESKGITRNDNVISVPDVSPNISLYLMERKGWTSFADLSTENAVQNKMDMGAKYLIFRSVYGAKPDSVFHAFLGDKVGTYTNPTYPKQYIEVWALHSRDE